ncbi:hypothetical protein DFJ58DRAFT_722735 [Suillus subalutaceus]|uniref:uncharacterized protein n=1 Tax=Suillus subalutaceus TaxID=48586 RepID=UPI001B867476|nr:uncharacterized protein DFJ58DRAFT_722735 [Suillus subalutaceus]KAG1871313.1 hypothetical protein DFJ58DRAFT_722735 [Suillus subalutaceus]
MNPLCTITVSSITIFQTIQAVVQAAALLRDYVNSLKNADSSYQSLLHEFDSILGILTTIMMIEKDTSLSDDLQFSVSRLVSEDRPVTKLKGELKELQLNEEERKNMRAISKLFWPFRKKEAERIAEKLRGYYRDITVILTIDPRKILKNVDQTVQELNKHQKDEQRRQFLKWMNPVSCIEKHNASCRQRNPKIGHWIFDAKEYKDWNNSDYALLILATAGHGKTILASSIINKIQGSNIKEPQTLGYFYCSFQDDRTTNAAAVFRSLIVQLLQQSELDWITQIGKQQESNKKGGLVSLQTFWQQNYDAKPHPTHLESLLKLLVEVSEMVHRPVLVIDALDECKDYLDLIRHLEKLPEDTRLRFFITSRSMPDVQDAFHGLPISKLSLKDNARQMKDIRVHIEEQLENQKRLSQLPDALKKTISEKLLENAQGMFRWVQCQLDEIVACNKLVDIEPTLDKIPAGLYETYNRIIEAIGRRGPRDNQIAHSCLLWLAGAFTPLVFYQLNGAMMIEVGQPKLNLNYGVKNPMDIVAACGSLVTYDEKTRVVALFHHSVKEYLITCSKGIFKSISGIHTRICKLLITYVLYDFVSVDEIYPEAIRRHSQLSHRDDVSEDHPLQSYANQVWKHLGHVSDEDPDVMTALTRLNTKFLRNNAKHPVLAPGEFEYKTRGLDTTETSPSLLFILLEHGKPWIVEHFVKKYPYPPDMDLAPGWGSSMIFVIAKNPRCLRILLNRSVDLNKPSSFKPGLYGRYNCSSSHTPISWAAVTGSEVAMNYLLSLPEVTLPDDILFMAVKADKPSHQCIRQFRRRGADVDFTQLVGRLSR